MMGCTASTSPSSNSASHPTNADYERTIKSRLATDPEATLAKVDVSADANRNEVTLTGSVPTEAQRTRIVELTKSAEPSLTLDDKIEVAPAEVTRSEYNEEMAQEARQKARDLGDKLGASLDDAWIHTKLLAKLAADRGTPALKLQVDVVDQNVTLRGEVESPQAKTEIGRLASETEGVKHVTNLLRVRSS